MLTGISIQIVKTRLVSRFVLLVLLTWFAAPEAQSYTPNYLLQINNHNTEPVLVQLEVVKSNPANDLAKNLILIFKISNPQQELTQTLTPAYAMLQVNSFQRNSFYVHTTTSAP